MYYLSNMLEVVRFVLGYAAYLTDAKDDDGLSVSWSA